MHKYKRRVWDDGSVGKDPCKANAFHKQIWRTCLCATLDYETRFWKDPIPKQ